MNKKNNNLNFNSTASQPATFRGSSRPHSNTDYMSVGGNMNNTAENVN